MPTWCTTKHTSPLVMARVSAISPSQNGTGARSAAGLPTWWDGHQIGGRAADLVYDQARITTGDGWGARHLCHHCHIPYSSIHRLTLKRSPWRCLQPSPRHQRDAAHRVASPSSAIQRHRSFSALFSFFRWRRPQRQRHAAPTSLGV